MIEIVLTVCVLANPYKCREVTREFESAQVVTPHACQQNAVLESVRFLEANPNYTVARFGCRRARLASKT